MDEQVLAVEDNEKNMQVLLDVLRAGEYPTLEATSAARAVELAAELIDVRVPDADGEQRCDGVGR